MNKHNCFFLVCVCVVVVVVVVVVFSIPALICYSVLKNIFSNMFVWCDSLFWFNPFHAADLFWPWEHQKTRFSNVFRGYQKRSVAWNGLSSVYTCRSTLVQCQNLIYDIAQSETLTWSAIKARSWTKVLKLVFVEGIIIR